MPVSPIVPSRYLFKIFKILEYNFFSAVTWSPVQAVELLASYS